MNSFFQQVKQSSGSDEYLTPREAVLPILPYVQGKRVWCPFDLPDSNFVQVLREQDILVLASHIESGQDFFTYAPPKESYDCICSNPPFSKRDAVLQRLFELQKPFMMLMNSSGIFDSRKRFRLSAIRH